MAILPALSLCHGRRRAAARAEQAHLEAAHDSVLELLHEAPHGAHDHSPPEP